VAPVLPSAPVEPVLPVEPVEPVLPVGPVLQFLFLPQNFKKAYDPELVLLYNNLYGIYYYKDINIS
jgi:hypothetical protein